MNVFINSLEAYRCGKVIKMKHALLITAYTDFDILARLISIYRKSYDCYIHVDAKMKLPAKIKKQLLKYDNVTVVQKYKVNWGSYRHISAILLLMKIAVVKNTYDFYHIISANTLILKSIEEMDYFFLRHRNNNFLEVINFVGTEQEKDIQEWFQYYHYPFLYNKKGKYSRLWNNFEYYFKKIQKKLGVQRNVNYTYKGYVYCHLSNDFVKYVIAFNKDNPSYIKNLKYCHVGEEFFFQNIIMNSEFKDTVINNHLIYDIWSEERGLPAALDMRDYEALKKTTAFFARKVDKKSEDLVDLLYDLVSV